MNPESGEGRLYLFVYGTLRRAAHTRWSRFLAEKSSFEGLGRTRGELFHLDGYPGMVAARDDDSWVRGEVCLLEGPAVLATLDAYEGCAPGDEKPYEFEREPVNVAMEDGRTLQAWAYFYRWGTEGRARIPSGDFFR